MLSLISGFKNNLLGNRGVGGLYSRESGGKELNRKGSILKLHHRERGRLEGSKCIKPILVKVGLKGPIRFLSWSVAISRMMFQVQR